MKNNPKVGYMIDHLKISRAARRADPAQDHPVALRLELRHDVRLGITVLDAIRSCEEIVGNKPLENALRMAGQQIADGKNTSAAFADLALFPPLVIRMLRIGEATGALDTALLNVSYFYNREVREAIGKLQAMIEPALTVVLGLVLGWVMLAVLGPVYDTISKMKF
jgi:type IV pilus assembly protein PilC